MRLRNFDKDGFWLKGNVHSHSTASDGDLPPEVMIQSFADRGYGFLSVTDHNHYVDYSDQKYGDMILIPGFELSGHLGGKPVHLNFIQKGSASPFQSGTHFRMENTEDTEDFCRRYKDQFLIILNHPDWSLLEFQDIEAHRIEVEVLANVAYTVEIPEECDWVTLIENPGTRALESKTVAFDVAAGRSSRNVTVTFRQTDGDAEASLYISQFNPNAQLVSIPDANFREALLGNGFILDASSEQCELTEVGLAATSIDFIPGCQIADLTGIEAFENLETLYCAMNQITHLDLSKNLALQTVVMSYNPLEEIILGDVNLTTLSLSGSLMTQGYPTIYSSGVRVSSSKLQTVDVSNNSQLTLLDVSDCPALTTVKARNCKYGKMVIRMRRAQEGTVSVDKDYTAKIEYVD